MKRSLLLCCVVLSLGLAGCETINQAPLDREPQVLTKAPAIYPFEMKKQGITGEVVVEFIVDTEGNVKDPRIISSPRRDFEAPVLSSISKWKFTPAIHGGRAVNARMQQRITFGLN
jgi:protein TonB